MVLRPTRLTIGPYSFAYRSAGDRCAVPLLFLHGFLGSGAELDGIGAALSGDFYCVSIDLPGHGGTRVDGGGECYGMSGTAEGLVGLLAALQIRRPALVGYSMGGRLALYLAVRFPHLFRAIVLLSASPGLKTSAERQERLAQDRERARALLTEGLGAFLDRWYDQPLFASLKTHPVFPSLLMRRRFNDPRGLSLSLRHMSTGAQPSLWSHLPDLSSPLLLLAGEQDTKFLALNAEMAMLCPAARLETVPGCGHAIHLEDPIGVGARIGRFLREATRARALSCSVKVGHLAP